MKNLNLNDLLVFLFENSLNLISRINNSDIIWCAENLDNILTKIYDLSSKYNLLLKSSLLLCLHYSYFINFSFLLQQLQGLFIIFLTSILWNWFKIHFNPHEIIFFIALFLFTILILTGISLILYQPFILLFKALGKIYIIFINVEEGEGSAGKKSESNRPDPNKPPSSEQPNINSSEQEEQERKRRKKSTNKRWMENEPPERRANRLAKRAKKYRDIIKNETPEQRTARLAKHNQALNNRRANETFEQREAQRVNIVKRSRELRAKQKAKKN
jgi:hypothetical protein